MQSKEICTAFLQDRVNGGSVWAFSIKSGRHFVENQLLIIQHRCRKRCLQPLPMKASPLKSVCRKVKFEKVILRREPEHNSRSSSDQYRRISLTATCLKSTKIKGDFSRIRATALFPVVPCPEHGRVVRNPTVRRMWIAFLILNRQPIILRTMSG